MNVKTCWSLLGLVALLCPCASWAETYNLYTTDDIVARIAGAKTGDVFVLSADSFEIASPIVVSVPCTVRGQGRDKTTITQTTKNVVIVSMKNAEAVFEDCTLKGSTFDAEMRTGCGVAIPSDGGGTVRGCTITGCYSTRNHNYGVAVDCRSASGLVSNCVITANTTLWNAGCHNNHCVYLSAGVLDHCLIANNACAASGGVSILGAATVRYCTITANSQTIYNGDATTGGGVYLGSTGGVFENCVIYGNKSYRYGSSSPEIHVARLGTFNKCVFPSDLYLPSIVIGTYRKTDVLFTDAANKDYTQKLSSPARDAGCYAPYDYEGGTFRCAISLAKSATLVNSPITLEGVVAGTNAEDTLTFAWTITKPDKSTEVFSTSSVSYTPTAAGSYTATLTVAKNGGTPVAAENTATFTVSAAEVAVTTGAELMSLVANACDDLVLTLAEDTYEVTDTLWLKRKVTIRGAGKDKSIIKMTAADKQVFIMQAQDVLIEGVTITGANINKTEGNHGAGIFMLAPGTVRNCRITGNKSSPNWTHGSGIAMIADGLIDHCVIDNNTRSGGSNKYGGGIYLKCSGTVDTCLVYGNSTYNWGGGVSVHEGSPKILNCTFTKNSAAEGGSGLGVISGTPTFRNCIFAGDILNSGDKTTGKPEWAKDIAIKAYNCLFGVNTATNANIGGTHVIGDPGYTDPANDDYHPLSSAASIDKGVAYEGMSETDLDGNPRVSGNGVDIGCYEFDASSVSVAFAVPKGGQGFVDEVATFKATITGTNGTEKVTTTWTFTCDQGGETVRTTADVDFLPPKCGTYSVSLSVSINGGKAIPFALADCYYASPRTTYVKEPMAENALAAKFPYDSWGAATTNLAVAVETLIAGGTIYLDAGTHILYEKLTIEKALDVFGKGQDITIVKPSFKNANIIVLNDESLVVSNMTFTGFYADAEVFDSGAVLIETRGGTVAHCRITGNRYAQKSINHAMGIGLTLHSEKALAHHCVIDRNQGALSLAYDIGGGVAFEGGTIDNCLICCNTNQCGGGVGTSSFACSTINIRNCTIVNNVSTLGYATSYDSYGGGGLMIYRNDNTKTHIVNTIIYGNSCPDPELNEIRTSTPLSKIEVTTCCFTNPFWKNPGACDYHLLNTPDSPCVNKATAYAGIPATDLDGNPRIRFRKPDIGCYEHQLGHGSLLILK